MTKTPMLFGVSAGAFTTGLIFAVKFFEVPHQDVIIPVVPMLVGAAISFLHFLSDYLQLDTKAERQLKKQLKTLENGIKSPHTSDSAKVAFRTQYDQVYTALLNLNAVKIREAKTK